MEFEVGDIIEVKIPEDELHIYLKVIVVDKLFYYCKSNRGNCGLYTSKFLSDYGSLASSTAKVLYFD